MTSWSREFSKMDEGNYILLIITLTLTLNGGLFFISMIFVEISENCPIRLGKQIPPSGKQTWRQDYFNKRYLRTV